MYNTSYPQLESEVFPMVQAGDGIASTAGCQLRLAAIHFKAAKSDNKRYGSVRSYMKIMCAATF